MFYIVSGSVIYILINWYRINEGNGGYIRVV